MFKMKRRGNTFIYLFSNFLKLQIHIYSVKEKLRVVFVYIKDTAEVDISRTSGCCFVAEEAMMRQDDRLQL